MEGIVCKRCGCIDDYIVEVKAHNHVATCSGCGAFIKNIPYEEPRFYFGKYKGTEIAKCNDKGYLEWVIKNTKQKGRTLKAIENRLSALIKPSV